MPQPLQGAEDTQSTAEDTQSTACQSGEETSKSPRRKRSEADLGRETRVQLARTLQPEAGALRGSLHATLNLTCTHAF